ncbi:uncharacterized protein LOC6616698 [Drosophila sechellia]|uniref:GD15168 n=3 Tax=melanogaster subgroup TaxID=32351 RepID=B4NTD1_DROSI|nr:uncharacterized protein LOC6616698 [Drosophila sechellia]XP_002076634.1 uncharacterized protein LOC6739743 [Drosophila simulans]XP_033167272.1 uncharacterized protein LOC117145651 [Drosophila mauritiana]EDW44701.1 GM15258 [Drosophila sechellia]EDX15821.1 GD15168 [Drosophila simulans]KMZ02946.1 uncharacterized protein Dsimw501_GD15168 [Drosophila simulans]
MIGRLSFWNKDNGSNEVDCLACRLVSGFGLLGIGAFLLAQSKKRRSKPLENFTMKGLAAAVGVLGVARLADAKFLKATAVEPKEQENTGTDHQFFSRR